MTQMYGPSLGSGLQTSKTLQLSCKMGKEFVFERVIDTLFMSGQRMMPNLYDTDTLVGIGAGASVITEINSSGIGGLLHTTDADSGSHLWKLPVEIDLSQAIDFRLLWTDVAGVAGSCLFAILYRPIISGTTALAVGTTALDTVLVDSALVTQYAPIWTEWGSIAAAKTGVVTLIPGEDALNLKITVTTLTTLSDAYLLGAQVRYYRKFIN